MSRCREIFAQMFEQPKTGTAAQRRALRRKGSVLDSNLEEVRSLEKKMGAEDRGRLNQYLTAIRETEIRTKRDDHGSTFRVLRFLMPIANVPTAMSLRRRLASTFAPFTT